MQGPLGSNAFTAGAFGNPDLKPERGKEVEAGFESDLFNRLHLDFTYYNKHTTNEIVAQNDRAVDADSPERSSRISAR